MTVPASLKQCPHACHTCLPQSWIRQSPGKTLAACRPSSSPTSLQTTLKREEHSTGAASSQCPRGTEHWQEASQENQGTATRTGGCMGDLSMGRGHAACMDDGLAGDVLEHASSPRSALVGAARTQPRGLSEQKLPAAEHRT